MLRFATVAVAALLLPQPPASALTLVGTVEVIDSDVLQLAEYQVYLYGVESIEADQTCAIGGQMWECYPAAVRALETLTFGSDLTCEVMSGPNFLDQVIAQCTINGEDVGHLYVRAGFGLALPGETDAYEDDMQAAQEEGVGLWKGRFYSPADWRRAHGIFIGRPVYRPPAAAN